MFQQGLVGYGGWRRGKFPFAALCLTLSRVGWRLQSPYEWVDHLGSVHLVNVEALRDVLRVVHDACVQWQLHRVQRTAGFEPQHVLVGPY